MAPQIINVIDTEIYNQPGDNYFVEWLRKHHPHRLAQNDKRPPKHGDAKIITEAVEA